MTPADLSRRLLALDWSGVGLEHQLAVSAAVASLSQGAASLVVNYPHQPGSPWFDGSEAWECYQTQPASNVIDMSEVFRREQTRRTCTHGSVTLPGGETEN
jgi:hypothetical protein